MSDLNYEEILKVPFVKKYISEVCGEGELDYITRPACYMIRNQNEDDREVHRVIVLPPKGYTADKLNMMNSHDEAEYASIEIKGSVREGKSTFSKIRNSLLVASYFENGIASDLGKPYVTYTLDDSPMSGFSKEIKSAGEPPFAVVKSDGFGFYHNLVNTTEEWLVLKLIKRIRPQKQPNIEEVTQHYPDEYKKVFENLYAAIKSEGDGIFKTQTALIDEVCNVPKEYSLPALAEMLYVFDTGMHEACSVFAVALKIGKQYPDFVIGFLQKGIKENTVLTYYANQLIQKIERSRSQVATKAA
ncbi:MAG: hypothetical protein AAF569_02350 [Pseudomonadota bacterium]